MTGLLSYLPQPIRRQGRYCREYMAHRRARIHPRPVLIGGSQKSGTTAIAALLAKATGSRFSNDPFWHALRYDARDYLLPAFLQEELTVKQFVDRHPAYFSAEVVKCPDFAYLFGQLHARFPASPLVFIVRDPRQNIRSILNRLGIPGDLERLGAAEYKLLAGLPAWGGIVAGEGLGPIEGNYVSRLAKRWQLAVHSYLAHRRVVHLVRYEDFLADKSGCISALAERVGLDPHRAIASDLNRQYQPAGDRGVQLDSFFGEKNLQIIESICADGMQLFGYS